MKNSVRKMVIAADRSGAGKTTVTCGLLSAFQRRGIRLQSFKCGPDYIDPMFHRQVLGIPSGNLDSFFTDAETLRGIFSEETARSGAELAVVEGVMGYYDGLGGVSSRASTWEIAGILEAPTVLVLDAKGISVSLAALLQGLRRYSADLAGDEAPSGGSDVGGTASAQHAGNVPAAADSRIRGVLLNRVSPMFYPRLKAVLEQHCPGVQVLGYLPELPELRLPSRHLGLVQPKELSDFQSWAERAARAVEEHVDLEALLRLTEEGFDGLSAGKSDHVSVASSGPLRPAAEAKSPSDSAGRQNIPPVRIAISEDEAFHFSYRENRMLLEALGAELVPFSPLRDAALPPAIDGLLLTGGYPELHTEALHANASMRQAVAAAVRAGLPTLAECGGYMYLLESIEGVPMCGVLPGDAVRKPRLVRFGYVEAETLRDSVLGPAGTVLRGHEFHRYDAAFNGADVRFTKPRGGAGGAGSSYEGMYLGDSLAAGFPHFYYRSNPKALAHFLTKCRAWKEARSIPI